MCGWGKGGAGRKESEKKVERNIVIRKKVWDIVILIDIVIIIDITPMLNESDDFW